jgi:hypothetical protein
MGVLYIGGRTLGGELHDGTSRVTPEGGEKSEGDSSQTQDLRRNVLGCHGIEKEVQAKK